MYVTFGKLSIEIMSKVCQQKGTFANIILLKKCSLLRNTSIHVLTSCKNVLYCPVYSQLSNNVPLNNSNLRVFLVGDSKGYLSDLIGLHLNV